MTLDKSHNYYNSLQRSLCMVNLIMIMYPSMQSVMFLVTLLVVSSMASRRLSNDEPMSRDDAVQPVLPGNYTVPYELMCYRLELREIELFSYSSLRMSYAYM